MPDDNEKNNDIIGGSLGLSPLNLSSVTSVSVVEDEGPAHDFGTARDTILTTIQEIATLADTAAQVAQQAQTPRAYEVAGKLYELKLKSAKELLDLSLQRKKIETIKNPDPNAPPGDIINNTLVVTGQDLQQMLNSMGIEAKR